MAKKKNFAMQNDMASYFFHQGTNDQAYRFLGCHMQREGESFLYTFRVWAPGVDRAFVVGDFCNWDTGIEMLRITERGVYEARFCSEHSLATASYKFKFERRGHTFLKGDPYAFFSKGGSDGASLIVDTFDYPWTDGAWLKHRKRTVTTIKGAYLATPLNIYEVHLASFDRHEDGRYLSYRELADELSSYVKAMGYTHVEILPVTEFPFDDSWGYQVTSYFAPTSRFGNPDDFRYFVNKMHECGIGVIMDWVPAHFPKDAWGLYEFDGAPLYEYQGKDRMESRSWGTRFFDLGREEVQSFLVSSALFFLREFHIDGLRVDAVASMLYLDYDRLPGEWIPNAEGNNRNLEAIAFLQKLNRAVFAEFSDVLMIAEESTDWYGITHSTDSGGLGFNLKWNMGWANDFYRYLSTDPLFRRYHHGALNFPLMYAFKENYVLPVSHDEVVHGKCSLIGKINGNYEDKFRQIRCALLLMMTYPGKKMLFMGSEYGQFSEWDHKKSLEWFMLEYPAHRALRDYVRALNHFYLATPSLYEIDFLEKGFSWIYADAADSNMVAFRRYDLSGNEVIVIIGFSGMGIDHISIPVQDSSDYEIVFSTEAGTFSPVLPQKTEEGYALDLSLQRMSGLILQKKNSKKTIQ